MSNIKAGKTNPSFDFLQKLLNKYKVINANWLITGDGGMTTNKTSPEPKGTRDGKTVDVDDDVMSLLDKIDVDQKNIEINYKKVRALLSVASQQPKGKRKPADAATPVDKIREQYASGELGRTNITRAAQVEKASEKKK